MPAIILPVGQDLGIHFLPDDEEPSPSDGLESLAPAGGISMQIHLGRDVVGVGADDYRTWLAAHEEPKRHAVGKFIRKSLIRVAAGEPFEAEDPRAAIDRLLKEGLLVEFDLERPLAFLRKYRLIPTGRGFGTTQEKPEAFRIGHAAEPTIEVDPSTFYLWSFAHRYGSMFEGCQAYAEESGVTTTAQMCKSFARQVPLLVASMCAYLDPEETP